MDSVTSRGPFQSLQFYDYVPPSQNNPKEFCSVNNLVLVKENGP